MTDMEPPSKEQLVKTTAIAAGIAVVMLFVAVLPAEYGIDPLGTGGLLGLTDDEAADDDSAHRRGDDPFQQYIITIQVPPTTCTDPTSPSEGGWIETDLKMWLDEGESFLYEWSATGDIVADLHTDDLGSYEGQPEIGTGGHGILTAPVSGYHGWAVRNCGDAGAEFTLSLLGEFDPDQDLLR